MNLEGVILLPSTRYDIMNRDIGKSSVLVAEDTEAYGRLISEVFGLMGFDVRQAANASQALEMMSESRFDLLFTDVSMPGPMDGIALASESLDRWPETRIIISTGLSELDLEQKARSWPLLKKPFRIKELEKLVGHVMSDDPPVQ